MKLVPSNEKAFNRITKKVNVLTDGCWRWTGSFTKLGYGRDRRGLAHRQMYEAVHGCIPVGSVIRHRCDNRYCVNPEHLVHGTQMQNVHDMKSRGREAVRIGYRNPNAKLTDADVSDIRNMFTIGWSAKTVAAAYSISREYANQLKRGLYRAVPTP